MSWWDDVVSIGEQIVNTASAIYSLTIPGVVIGLIGDAASGQNYTYGDHLEIGNNGVTTEKLFGGTSFLADNPITQALKDENDAAQAAADAAQEASTSNEAYINASWESAANAASTTYNRMLEDAQTAEQQNETNFASNISAMKNQYGYTDESGNHVLGEQSQQLVTLNNQLVAANSKRMATAGASGVKLSGSVKAADTTADQAAADALKITTQSEKLSAQNAATQTGQAYTTQKTAIARQRDDAGTLLKNWGGSFDWTSFSSGATPDSLYYRQYKSQLASNNASATAAAYQYTNALKESDPYNLWNYASYASNLLGLGTSIASLIA